MITDKNTQGTKSNQEWLHSKQRASDDGIRGGKKDEENVRNSDEESGWGTHGLGGKRG